MRLRDYALVALYAAVGGLFSLAYALRAGTGCTLMACRSPGLPSLSGVSLAHRTVRWSDGCNGCWTDLTPVLLACGLLLLSGALVVAAGVGHRRRRVERGT